MTHLKEDHPYSQSFESDQTQSRTFPEIYHKASTESIYGSSCQRSTKKRLVVLYKHIVEMLKSCTCILSLYRVKLISTTKKLLGGRRGGRGGGVVPVDCIE